MFSVSVVPHSPTGVERSPESPIAHHFSYPPLPVATSSPLAFLTHPVTPGTLLQHPHPCLPSYKVPVGDGVRILGLSEAVNGVRICFRWSDLEPPYLSVPCTNHTLLQPLDPQVMTVLSELSGRPGARCLSWASNSNTSKSQTPRFLLWVIFVPLSNLRWSLL